MIHPHTELRFINDKIGFGVVATKFIPKGTITWVIDPLDREFTPQDLVAMGPAYADFMDTFCYRNRKGNSILCWDNGRFVNHSFKSNCLSTAYEFEFAIRDIHPGEELTDDYGYLNVSEPFEALDEGLPRTTVYPDDILTYHEEWDAKVFEAFKAFPGNEQPLGSLISPEKLDLYYKIARGEAKMESILSCYFDPNRA